MDDLRGKFPTIFGVPPLWLPGDLMEFGLAKAHQFTNGYYQLRPKKIGQNRPPF